MAQSSAEGCTTVGRCTVQMHCEFISAAPLGELAAHREAVTRCVRADDANTAGSLAQICLCMTPKLVFRSAVAQFRQTRDKAHEHRCCFLSENSPTKCHAAAQMLVT
jgi:hypothetical protein